MDPSRLSPDEISDMPYADFVGLVNQWNVPPGAFSTLKKWILYADIKDSSHIFEVACTTGFSLRETSLLTGCSGFGIDVAPFAVKTANINKRIYAPSSRIEYKTQDLFDYSPDRKYSHVIVGAALRFINKPEEAVSKIISLLETKGHLLAAEYYTPHGLPQALIDEAVHAFDIRPTTANFKEVTSVYRGFNVMYKDDNKIPQETNREIQLYCVSTIQRLNDRYPSISKDQEDVIYKRLTNIRHVSNRLRPYQRYCVLVLRHDGKTNPSHSIARF